MSFQNLHVHTSAGSILDGLTSLDDLVAFAVANEQSAIGKTDHGTLFGTIPFYEKCRSAGIKPLVGCEVYITDTHNNLARESTRHLILMAASNVGYGNLCTLVTRANLEGFFYKPRVSLEMLREHSEGLVVLSGCLGGEVAQEILTQGNPLRVVETYKEIFGDRYFLEMQDHGQEDDVFVCMELQRLSKITGVPLVATNDSHYTRPEDHEVHDIMLCIQTLAKLNDDKRFRFSGEPLYHLATEEFMLSRPNLSADAVTNSSHVAELCNVTLDLHQSLLPEFSPLPNGYSASQYLRDVASQGMDRRYGDGWQRDSEKHKRFNYELEVIERQEFESYFLIVWDLVRHSHDSAIAVGPGRGSAAGSIVAFALRITNVDPLKYGLIFERFLNLERIKQPDIDLDLSDTRRDEVIRYAENKYGTERVAQISTVGTLGARSAIRSVARVLDVPIRDSDALAKAIPYDQFGATIDGALKDSPEFADAYRRTGGWEHRVIDVARSLEGVSRSQGTHAAGVIISPTPLRDLIPLHRPKNGDVTSTIAGYEMDDLAEIGLLKIDFLGLSTLSLITEASGYAGIDINDIDLNDARTFELLRKGDTHGIFQLEPYGARKVLTAIVPASIEDIAVAIAVNRPGPLQGGVLDAYVGNKRDPRRINYIDSRLASILAETFGTIVYQEQILSIAHELAGFTLGEADGLREAVGKKDKKKMASQKRKFINGVGDKAVGQQLWDLIEQFAAYGFNKAHAIGYALLGYQTAYLKAHYPREFMCALLNMRGDDKVKVQAALQDARRHGIKVEAPHYAESTDKFTPVAGGDIRYGLVSIPDFGTSAYTSLKAGVSKCGGQFSSLHALLMACNLSKLNTKAVGALLKAGALNDLGDVGEMTRNLDLEFRIAREEKEDARRVAEGGKPVNRKNPARHMSLV